MGRKQSRGTCIFCQKELSKGGLTRHLGSCKARENAIAATKSKAKDQPIYHLTVTGIYSPDYWLHLEIKSKATLGDLDAYLRGIWLECCGHMSSFDIHGQQYSQSMGDFFGFGFENDDKPLTTKIGKALSVGDKAGYTYDFGSSTMLVVEVKKSRVGKPLTKHPVYLMARNKMPELACIVCGNSAEFLCTECLYEDETTGHLCAAHTKDHPHEDYGEPLQIGNSPRMGECAYAGPSNPPY